MSFLREHAKIVWAVATFAFLLMLFGGARTSGQVLAMLIVYGALTFLIFRMMKEGGGGGGGGGIWGGGGFLCDSCLLDYGNACSRPERPNATQCPDYKKRRGYSV